MNDSPAYVGDHHRRVDVRAAGADGLELGLLVCLEVVGAGQQPAGDLAGLRDRRGPGRVRRVPAGMAGTPGTSRAAADRSALASASARGPPAARC